MAYGNRSQRFVYDRSPHFVKNIISSYYGWVTYRGKYGEFYKSHFDRLCKTQWLSTQELLKLQEEETLRFVRYSYDSVPHYRELFEHAGLTPSDIRCLDDISMIPILTKEMVRQNSERLLSREFDEEDVVWEHTGGTTGKALEIALSKECFQREYAFNWLHR